MGSYIGWHRQWLHQLEKLMKKCFIVESNEKSLHVRKNTYLQQLDKDIQNHCIGQDKEQLQRLLMRSIG